MKSYSKDNHYTDKHSQRRYTSREIETNLNKAKRVLLNMQELEHGYNFCEDKNHAENIKGKEDYMEARIFDCSHEVSVKKCKELSEIEKIWDVNNMKIRDRICHRIFDKSN
jgi:hypothetical protein